MSSSVERRVGGGLEARGVTEISYGEHDPLHRESYQGAVVRGRPHGRGVLRWRQGNYTRFEGEFRAGEMHQGTLFFGHEGKSTYRGELHHNRAEGEGELVPDVADDGNLAFYRGRWEAGHKKGVGFARFRDGHVYEGEWVQNKMCGKGAQLWADGTLFAGHFRDDLPHGPGAIHFVNGTRASMEFQQGYPTALRLAARIVCGALFLITLLYVSPHVMDMLTPEEHAPCVCDEASFAHQVADLWFHEELSRIDPHPAAERATTPRRAAEDPDRVAANEAHSAVHEAVHSRCSSELEQETVERREDEKEDEGGGGDEDDEFFRRLRRLMLRVHSANVSVPGHVVSIQQHQPHPRSTASSPALGSSASATPEDHTTSPRPPPHRCLCAGLHALPLGSSLTPRPSERVLRDVVFLARSPTWWLWLWSPAQQRMRATLREEATALAHGGLKGVRLRGLWGWPNESGEPWTHRGVNGYGEPLGPSPLETLARIWREQWRSRDRSRDRNRGTERRVRGLEVSGGDESVGGGGGGGESVGGDNDDDDDEDDGSRKTAEERAEDEVDEVEPSEDANANVESGGEIDWDAVWARRRRTRWGPRSSGGRSRPVGVHHQASRERAGSSTAPANPPAAGLANEAPAASTLLTVLTLYLRLHLKRQLHYLRLGMMALFTLTGDLEDATAAFLWPALCWLLALRLPRTVSRAAGCDRVPDTVFVGFAMALASLLVLAFAVTVVIAFPENVAELLRVTSMDALTLVKEGAVGT